MRVTLVPCDPAANASESRAFEFLKTRLQSQAGNGCWFLLSNLTFSVNHQALAEEIDLVAIGPPGVRVVEIKHWSVAWMENNPRDIETEAQELNAKARKLATTLRRTVPELPLVEPVFLLTREQPKGRIDKIRPVLGVPFFTLPQWSELYC
ncbi:MAG: NERD domain-containing protein [Candidatus Binatia bacterium]|nr:NERD domain-containing protein [Candidatus Binatia bacterium]